MTESGMLKNKNNPAAIFLNSLKNRVGTLNKNALIAVVGEPGSGKSYVCLALSWFLSGGKFWLKKHKYDDPEKFIGALTQPDVFEKADWAIFEEVGVKFSARNWQSKPNQYFGAVLQTFRSENLGVFFNVPDLSFIDVQGRKLFHYLFETQYIDRQKNVCGVKVIKIQRNHSKGKTYYKYPLIWLPDKKKFVKLKILQVPLPPRHLIDEYELEKKAFNEALNKEALQKIKEARKKKKDKDAPKKHECTWRYYAREKLWRCRNCLNETKENPFKK